MTERQRGWQCYRDRADRGITVTGLLEETGLLAVSQTQAFWQYHRDRASGSIIKPGF